MIIIADISLFYKRIYTFFPEKLFLFKSPTILAQQFRCRSPLGGFTNDFLPKRDIPDCPIVIFLSFRC